VRNSLGQTVAALNISGQANRTSAEMMRDQLLPQLLRTCDTISQLLRRRGAEQQGRRAFCAGLRRKALLALLGHQTCPTRLSAWLTDLRFRGALWMVRWSRHRAACTLATGMPWNRRYLHTDPVWGFSMWRVARSAEVQHAPVLIECSQAVPRAVEAGRASRRWACATTVCGRRMETGTPPTNGRWYAAHNVFQPCALLLIAKTYSGRRTAMVCLLFNL
jgi:hypothetical protein